MCVVFFNFLMACSVPFITYYVYKHYIKMGQDIVINRKGSGKIVENFCNQIYKKAEKKKVNIKEGDDRPVVLIVPIKTPADDDIEETMRDSNLSGELFFYSLIFYYMVVFIEDDCGSIILLRIVPIPSWEAKSYRKRGTNRKFKLDLTFLVDPKEFTLLECDLNKGELRDFLESIGKQ